MSEFTTYRYINPHELFSISQYLCSSMLNCLHLILNSYLFTLSKSFIQSQVDSIRDAKDFQAVNQAMKASNFDASEIETIWKLIAAIIILVSKIVLLYLKSLLFYVFVFNISSLRVFYFLVNFLFWLQYSKSSFISRKRLTLFVMTLFLLHVNIVVFPSQEQLNYSTSSEHCASTLVEEVILVPSAK